MPSWNSAFTLQALTSVIFDMARHSAGILKEIFSHEVFPALGCTEPIAVAYAAAIAAKEVAGEIDRVKIRVDPGVYKNGLAVTIPNTGGLRGNLIAGVLGALIKQPALKMEVLKEIQPQMIARAKDLISGGKAGLSYDPSKTDLYIDVTVRSGKTSARAVIEHGHTNLVLLEKNRKAVYANRTSKGSSSRQAYKKRLKKLTVMQLVETAESMDRNDYRYIEAGVRMNLEIAEAGKNLKKVGYYLSDLVKKGYLLDDVFSSSKILVASASDARMAGLNYPVMASGGSGNQGIVAILVPHNVGKFFKVAPKKVLCSIALSHLINGYIKCYTGDLSPLCGCSIAAGVGAAVAVVYQLKGKDLKKITFAVNNLISDLGGMLCDGAKSGCALKVVSSADAAIRSAYMAINDHGITAAEGFVGRTAEDTIRNLSRISAVGMAKVDDTMLGIMKRKV
jgi:L-cysteine desulfidase